VNARVDFASLLRAMRSADPTDVPDMVAAAASRVGGTDVVVYLVDFEEQVLQPLPDHSAHEEPSHVEEVGTTIAGRAYLHRRPMTAERPDGTRVWVPLLEGSHPTGVIALTVPTADELSLAVCEDLGVLAGYLVATQARVTDLFSLHRRRQGMTLPASMQWDLLPPLTLASRWVGVAGMLEPAYEVGGDCFDYALNEPSFDFIFMDAMGHGLRSAMVAGLAVGCYRHARRAGRALPYIHQLLDTTLASELGGRSFVTGHVGRLELGSGTVTWITAGHPSPLLLRHGQVIGPLEGPRTVPWGLGRGRCEPATATLEPGDTLVLYSDGVVEARGAPGADFGVDRLTDLIGQQASDQVPIALIVRLVVRAVLEHHGGRLSDDATILMFNWPGPVAGALPPLDDS
jgi:serine phosphatase RsbU (regulator of sigma subunit)